VIRITFPKKKKWLESPIENELSSPHPKFFFKKKHELSGPQLTSMNK